MDFEQFKKKIYDLREKKFQQNLNKLKFYFDKYLSKDDLKWLLNHGLSAEEIEFFLDRDCGETKEDLFYVATHYDMEVWIYVEDELTIEGFIFCEDYFMEDLYDLVSQVKMDDDVIEAFYKLKHDN